MNIQLIVMAILAAVVTAPMVLLVPRARHSPVFDGVLWLATWLLSFLCGSYAATNLGGALAGFKDWMIADVPILVVLLGAGAGAVLLNGLLWLMDRFAPPEVPEPAELEEEVAEKTTDPEPPGA